MASHGPTWQAAFHKRITFCLNVHNDAVKAMSYPDDGHKGEQDPDEVRDCAKLLRFSPWRVHTGPPPPHHWQVLERQREEEELAQQLAEDDYD